MDRTYLQVTQEAGRAFVSRHFAGPVVMLNLLRYRAVADYSATPELAPATLVSADVVYGLPDEK